ncbi:hypothetical protein VCCP1035_1725A, partial [Vibrio cholerae CP1035(8)]
MLSESLFPNALSLALVTPIMRTGRLPAKI